MDNIDDVCANRVFGASVRMISAMPMVIEYSAYVFATYQRGDQNGEPAFRRTYPPRLVDVPYQDRDDRDAFALRDSFLTVSNPTEALNFLREAGDFDLGSGNVTWTLFRRWQAYAQAMHVKEEREAVFCHTELPTEADRTYREMVHLARRAERGPDCILPHTYFGESKPLPTSGKEWDGITRYERAISETPEGAALRIDALKREIEAGQELGDKWQRELEAQFVRPVLGSYEVDWNRERPAIVFRPRCALEAIANAIQVDRLAGIRYTRCLKERCRRIIPVGDQQSKHYCNRQCMDAARKQRQRQRTAANSK